MSGKVHVCSLSMSCLTKINKVIHDVENEDIPDDEKYRLRWLQVAMEYNRQTQLQFVYAHCGDKGKDPKFRAIRLATFLKQWKRQVIRDEWNKHIKDVAHFNVHKRIDALKEEMNAQRSEIAARYYPRIPFSNFDPIMSLFRNTTLTNRLNIFEAPCTCRPGYYIRGYQFLESTAVRTLSTAPTETNDESKWA